MSRTRAFFTSFRIPGLSAPHDTATLKVYYPATYSNSDLERNTGQVPCDDELSPFPVVIFLPGVNVEPSSYGWLAAELAAHGIVTAIPSLIAEEMPGCVSLTPGIDISALKPAAYGSRPSAILLAPLVEKLGEINRAGLLAGRLDLSRLALGGHSAGGTLALLNGRREWLPSIRAAFSYGSHTGAATALGWAADTLLAPAEDLPLLLAGGERDGCIAASGRRYGGAAAETENCSGRIEETFQRAVAENGGNNWLCILRAANHFTACHRVDDYTGRGVLDYPVNNGHQARAVLGELFATFLAVHLRGQPPERLSATVAEYRQQLVTAHHK